MKHLGATHCDNADQWVETEKRVQAGFYAVKRVAKYWSLGTSHGRGSGTGLHTTKKLRVMRAVVEGTLLACGKSRVWSLAQERKANQVMARGIRRCLGVDRCASLAIQMRPCGRWCSGTPSQHSRTEASYFGWDTLLG